jgi:tetratricopeptide (TPR) repeat protein
VRAISSVKERVDLLQHAVDLDPNFALAWSKLASERARARGYGITDDRAREVGLAQQAMARAKALAPDDPQVRIDEAALHLHGLDDQQGAIRLYEEVLRQAPYNIEALSGLSEVLGELNRVVEEVQVLERALAVDARHGAVMTRLANNYGHFRHFDRALELRRRLIGMRPDELDRHAGFQIWNYRATGKWDEFDKWRATLPPGAEARIARIRNLDADRAISRRDYASVHRLIDVDSADWKKDLSHRASIEAGFLVLHSLTWRAQGDDAKARQAARRALAQYEALVKSDKDFDDWFPAAQCHAILGDRAASLQAFDKDIASTREGGNLWVLELYRRRRVYLDALLGDHAAALAELARQSRLPGFLIHDERVKLDLALLWDRPEFLALVADPATNAPLPLDTPVSPPAR